MVIVTPVLTCFCLRFRHQTHKAEPIGSCLGHWKEIWGLSFKSCKELSNKSSLGHPMTHLTLDTQGAVLRPDLEVFSKSRMSNGNIL